MSAHLSSDKKNIALITNDVIGPRMAGPGIRYWELARVLSRDFSVRLIVPPYLASQIEVSQSLLPTDICVCKDAKSLRREVQQCDIVVTLGNILTLYPFLTRLDKFLVVDLYDPYLLSGLARDAQKDMAARLETFEDYWRMLNVQLRVGDFFLCAAEKQRDYWLGMLSAIGRINPYTYTQDSTFRRLIDVVPFGLPSNPPQHTKTLLKGVYKGIGARDRVILWGGGIWNWFDASTIIQAMPLVLQEAPDVKLFFMGIKRPNSGTSKMKAVGQAISLSKDLGLYEKAIFFNDWASYEERQNYLLEADIGISLHQEHIETQFAFRTRLLDYLWAKLPSVVTTGDVLGEMLAEHKLAYLVKPGDVDGVARTVLTLLNNSTLSVDYASQFSQVASRFYWETVVQPLINFCHAPAYAADKGYLSQHVQRINFTEQRGIAGLAVKAWRVIRTAWVKESIKTGKAYLRRGKSA